MATQVLLKTPEFYTLKLPQTEASTIYNSGPKIKPPKISLNEIDLAEKISESMANGGGVFELTDLGDVVAPFDAIKELFKKLEDPEMAKRVNAAYTNNLVYKDSYGNGNGGAGVDEKKVIDLSPSRLDTIVTVDKDLADEFGTLGESIEFFDRVRSEVAPKVLSALAKVVGDPALANGGFANYRMVDYPSRPSSTHRNFDQYGPRCGAHRDFGTLTLIFPDGTSGLEVLFDEKKELWRQLEVSPGSAVLLFGWCANIRSNDRVPAALHRVVDAESNEADEVPRRLSAVFFLAPAPESMLTPKLRYKGEQLVYRSFTAGELKTIVGRKWRYREGTLANEKDFVEEKEEAKMFPTQDDIIQHLFKFN